MAEMPKLTSRELTVLIKAATSLEERLALVEQFCDAWDAEHAVRREMNYQELHRRAAPTD
jgi:hypothetical protein